MLKWYIGLAIAGQVALVLVAVAGSIATVVVGAHWLGVVAILLFAGFFFVIVTQAKRWCRGELAKLDRREMRGMTNG
ncbi:MAG: hypothetical protein HYS89_00685 [Candidatus Colwellbacteria bacterium]|nr:hypothetical protein [Candidatus Colwellbacteria bacterium]